MSAPDPDLASALMVVLETEADREYDKDAPAVLEMAWTEVTDRLKAGAEVNGWHEGKTLLGHAVGWSRADIAELLLEHGARVNDPVLERTDRFPAFTVAQETLEPAMARLLARHGADPVGFDRSVMAAATKAELVPPQDVRRDAPHLATVQRGSRNPQPFRNPFYINQIRSFDSAYAGLRRDFGTEIDACGGGLSPVFSFDRFGRTATRLPDGRLVLIAGEHEDSYDPDFCIYNDVCVIGEDGDVAYFVYPVEDFPPTDFHSATLLDDHILMIGNLGYPEQREAGTTQVLRLDIGTWRVTRIETGGDSPGWISRHTADLIGDDIVVCHGKPEPGDAHAPKRHALNIRTLRWREVT